jgi:hypothetical protein
MPRRLDDLIRFCDILETLERRIGGRRLLADCHGRMDWPQRGVYFFMEEGERRTDTGEGLRIVRVGTHALKAGSGTTLWDASRSTRGRRNPVAAITADRFSGCWSGRRSCVYEVYGPAFLDVLERLVGKAAARS